MELGVAAFEVPATTPYFGQDGHHAGEGVDDGDHDKDVAEVYKEADEENWNEKGEYDEEEGNVYRDDIDDGEGEGDEELEEEGC